MVSADSTDKSGDAAYPELVFALRPDLPELKQAVPVPAMFEDSTHQLWHCHTEGGEMMLKICQQHLTHSPCWQVIWQLFGRYLPDDLGSIDAVQKLLEQRGQLSLPALITCDSETQTLPAFMLSRFVHGRMLTPAQVTDEMVVQLGRHIASLHNVQFRHWGAVESPQNTRESWPEELLKTLVKQCAGQDINEPWLGLAVSQIEQINPASFSPIMLDNRWDQYLFDDKQIIALVDIDAFVAGPAELELVLLEYQLTPHQAALFADSYQQLRTMPDLSRVRLAYRLLLFLMNALGETRLDQWMQAQAKW